MSSSEQINDILRRFVDDRDALEEHEYAALAAAIKASPELAMELRDQLMMDDALSQRLAIDRRQFDAQVQQRIADHLRGEDELNRQADELRELALARLEKAPTEPPTSWTTWAAWGSALVILLAAGLGLWMWQKNRADSLLAKVESVEGGDVIVKRFPNGNDELAQNGLTLRLGDKLIVSAEALIKLRWTDGTLVQLAGGSSVDLPATRTGKRVYIHQGDVAAVVAKQPVGRPMIFGTPHAEATVRGTELYLHVSEDDTRLDVAEGSVELAERETNDVALVATSQSAKAATGQRVEVASKQFPTSLTGLIYAVHANQRTPIVRSGSMLRPSELSPQGAADFNASGEMVLTGGCFEDVLAAEDIAAKLRASGELTIEAVITVPFSGDEQEHTIFALCNDDGPVLSLKQMGLNMLAVAVGAGDARPFTHAAAPNERMHVIAIISDARITTYADGQFMKQPRAPLDLANVRLSKLVFGGSESERWQGSITGVAIYDRVLTQEEIARSRPLGQETKQPAMSSRAE